jgi:hypothetical protein
VRRCRRLKRPVGERLAIAAFNQVYGGTRASTGPTISGCKASASKLTLEFDPALLKSSKVVVQPIANITTEPTMLQVLAQKKTIRKRGTCTHVHAWATPVHRLATFLSCVLSYGKTRILPRQAQDKHRVRRVADVAGWTSVGGRF